MRLSVIILKDVHFNLFILGKKLSYEDWEKDKNLRDLNEGLNKYEEKADEKADERKEEEEEDEEYDEVTTINSSIRAGNNMMEEAMKALTHQPSENQIQAQTPDDNSLTSGKNVASNNMMEEAMKAFQAQTQDDNSLTSGKNVAQIDKTILYTSSNKSKTPSSPNTKVPINTLESVSQSNKTLTLKQRFGKQKKD